MAGCSYDLHVPAEALRRNWYWSGRTRDAAVALEAVRVPVLAFYGDEDDLVPPIPSAARARHALRDNAQATVRVVPGADHELRRPFRLLRPGEPLGFAPGVLDEMVRWMRQHSAVPGGG